MNPKSDVQFSPPSYEDLVAYDQVAEDLRVSKETVRDWLKNGDYSIYRQPGKKKPYLDRREIAASFQCEGKGKWAIAQNTFYR